MITVYTSCDSPGTTSTRRGRSGYPHTTPPSCSIVLLHPTNERSDSCRVYIHLKGEERSVSYYTTSTHYNYYVPSTTSSSSIRGRRSCMDLFSTNSPCRCQCAGNTAPSSSTKWTPSIPEATSSSRWGSSASTPIEMDGFFSSLSFSVNNEKEPAKSTLVWDVTARAAEGRNPNRCTCGHVPNR